MEFTQADGFESMKDLVTFVGSCGLNFALGNDLEITVKFVKKYKELMQQNFLDQVNIIMSSEVYTVVTLHHVPSESDLKVLYARIGEYGKVFDHFKCVHEDIPTIYNGRYRFKINFKSFPRPTIALVNVMLWLALRVRPESVVSVGRQDMWSRTEPLSLYVGYGGGDCLSD
mgnify:CR=1 FL=1